ncbi:polyprenyl synthetase family protein [Bombiscardovia apis]|uniref:polyprenyl synthetase family protein n=1 Tax=Bombiscardovia apis TaxID=2932182 RepID=UPI00295599A5|nr:polyprenyl synthetase family protein [Bombiscardovia apis]
MDDPLCQAKKCTRTYKLNTMDYTTTRQVVEQAMDRQIANYFAQCTYPTQGLLQAVERAVKAQASHSSQGGKRLRALLLLACYQAASSPSVQELEAVPFPTALIDSACALEIFQTSALIHDDIIDEAPLRRSQPSAHIALASSFQELTGTASQQAARAGQSLGLLLGNLLAACATEAISKAAASLPRSEDMRQAFARMVGRVNQGQIMDLTMESLPLDHAEPLRQAAHTAIALKTASYTTVAPIELGLLAAGRDPHSANCIAHKLGRSLGLAYQLRDDLLDVTGSPETTGKPLGGDIREGKRTLLLCEALVRTSGKERERLISIYETGHPSEAEVTFVRQIFASCGAIDAISAYAQELKAQSQEALTSSCQQLDLDTNSREKLSQACDLILPQA